jgi:hypothetical protein
MIACGAFSRVTSKMISTNMSETVDEALRQLLSHGVKSGGIAIPNPVVSAPLLHQSSVNACNILIKALQDGGGLNAEAHKAVVKAAGN